MKRCTISALCRLAGMRRQAYYQDRRVRQRQGFDEERVLDLVRRMRALHPRMGARKLHHELKPAMLEAGIALGRDRFFELLRRHGLLVARKKKRVRTTYHDPVLPVYRNLLYEREPIGAHQIVVADITYIALEAGFVYLFLITDLFSRMIIGYHCAETLEASGSVEALRMALAQLPPESRPIHHSDRGSQYCCHEYVEALLARGLSVSMTEQNHCYENCYAERVNGILKDEYNLDARFRDKAQADRAIAQAIELYNHHRPHLSLQMRTPAKVHHAA